MPSSHRPWGEVRTTFLHSVCFQMSPQNVPHAVHITECCCCRSRGGCFRSHKPVKIIFLSLLILTEYDNGNDDDYHFDANAGHLSESGGLSGALDHHGDPHLRIVQQLPVLSIMFTIMMMIMIMMLMMTLMIMIMTKYPREHVAIYEGSQNVGTPLANLI